MAGGSRPNSPSRGEKIRPRLKADTVKQFDGMNRHQRRAAERDQRKNAR